MNKYESYRQELIRDLLNKKIDSFYLIDTIIKLKIEIEELEKLKERT